MTDAPDSIASPHVYALPPGTRLHEYEIRSVLGHGGFGITYLALDTLLDETVAIKEYLPSYLASRLSDKTVGPKAESDRDAFQKGVEAYLNEARTIARFRHPNIVQVRRYFEMNGTGYIVLNYESGPSIDKLLESGPIAEAPLRAILLGALSGLEVVHAAGVLHRDLKPSNIIVRADGSPVLIDFGAARDFQARQTHMTTIMSPGYAPPEQYGEGGVQGAWTDFYALGATAYHCMTGKKPADSLHRLQMARGRKDPLMPAEKAGFGHYDAMLRKLVDWMLRLDEKERPKSAADLRNYLETPNRLSMKPPPAERKSRLGLVAALVVGLALLVGVGAYVASRLESARDDDRRAKQEATQVEQMRRLQEAAYDRDRIEALLRTCAPGCAPSTIAEAQRRLRQIDGEAATFRDAADDQEKLRAYTQNCIACRDRAAADARLDALRAEDAAAERRRFEEAQADDESYRNARSRSALETYLRDCSLCAHRDEAERRLAALPIPPAVVEKPVPGTPPEEGRREATLPAADAQTRLVTDPVTLNEIKNRLFEQNLDPGEPGTPKMTEAVRRYEEKAGLPPLDQPTEALLQSLRSAASLKPWGAIVFAKDESKWGMAWSASTRREAQADARAKCGSDRCTAIVAVAGRQCAAFALSSRNWSINWRDDEGSARRAALDDCGKGGAACRIIGATCADGTGRFPPPREP